MHPKNISILDYSYHLPEEKIATYPLNPRDNSKLLIFDKGKIKEDVYCNLHQHLPEDTLLVFNNTKVVEARLLFEKITGSTIEIFCLEPSEQYADITTAMLQKEKVFWQCLVGGAKKWKEEWLIKSIEYKQHTIELKAKMVEKRNDYFLIEFCWNNTQLSFAEILHIAGVIPLPPYIKRNTEEKDKETYQTIYAKYDGSVAAPTAGLHFTKNLLQHLAEKNIQTAYVTLHVGAGTFKPVKAATMQEHEMHAEFLNVSKSFIEQLIHYTNKKIVAVGTTSLRTIESLYWIGIKLEIANKNNVEMNDISLTQWEVYELPQNISVQKALNNVLQWMNNHHLQNIITKTQIIIAPNYSLKIADGLITNFHQPQSTLLLLVAAIVGNDWKNIYDYALKNNFRFLSYGDGSLLWGNKGIID
ncbi:MAG: S-adenosylmethionine:tRNA ribosyltransferase-isomerase [Chitinophagaceae bacterium]|nr:S-adenosylmethionine:tRNA ribosyltransferase-isomerase [Chitinophagaceae bacterium]MCW5904981.1 S-adenosylmethionine:tRNA ribosyltransferase-isomerase [Chitinophagaceae bacterium]